MRAVVFNLSVQEELIAKIIVQTGTQINTKFIILYRAIQIY